jgi:hypothetical protein
VTLEAPARPAARPAEEIDITVALAEDIAAAPAADSPQPSEPAPVSAPRPLTGGLGVAWTVLFALAVALAVGTVVLAVVGLLGGSI